MNTTIQGTISPSTFYLIESWIYVYLFGQNRTEIQGEHKSEQLRVLRVSFKAPAVA